MTHSCHNCGTTADRICRECDFCPQCAAESMFENGGLCFRCIFEVATWAIAELKRRYREGKDTTRKPPTDTNMTYRGQRVFLEESEPGQADLMASDMMQMQNINIIRPFSPARTATMCIHPECFVSAVKGSSYCKNHRPKVKRKPWSSRATVDDTGYRSE